MMSVDELRTRRRALLLKDGLTRRQHDELEEIETALAAAIREAEGRPASCPPQFFNTNLAVRMSALHTLLGKATSSQAPANSAIAHLAYWVTIPENEDCVRRAWSRLVGVAEPWLIDAIITGLEEI